MIYETRKELQLHAKVRHVTGYLWLRASWNMQPGKVMISFNGHQVLHFIFQGGKARISIKLFKNNEIRAFTKANAEEP